ncbi:hypothetical protein, partial [Verrucomicrobium spinosum]|uniref:hypothetical protein n=1 Tax=Verrucomicrobium spinosum TaxID=2736 RepID=UPI001C4558DE
MFSHLQMYPRAGTALLPHHQSRQSGVEPPTLQDAGAKMDEPAKNDHPSCCGHGSSAGIVAKRP